MCVAGCSKRVNRVVFDPFEVLPLFPPQAAQKRTFKHFASVPKAVVPNRVNSIGFDSGSVYDLRPLFCLAIPQ
jgi:hypothetical protein